MRCAPCEGYVCVRYLLAYKAGARVGSLIIPETVQREVVEKAEVVAIGPGPIHDGKRWPLSTCDGPVKVGASVILQRYASNDQEQEGEVYALVKYAEVLAVVTD